MRSSEELWAYEQYHEYKQAYLQLRMWGGGRGRPLGATLNRYAVRYLLYLIAMGEVENEYETDKTKQRLRIVRLPKDRKYRPGYLACGCCGQPFVLYGLSRITPPYEPVNPELRMTEAIEIEPTHSEYGLPRFEHLKIMALGKPRYPMREGQRKEAQLELTMGHDHPASCYRERGRRLSRESGTSSDEEESKEDWFEVATSKGQTIRPPCVGLPTPIPYPETYGFHLSNIYPFCEGCNLAQGEMTFHEFFGQDCSFCERKAGEMVAPITLPDRVTFLCSGETPSRLETYSVTPSNQLEMARHLTRWFRDSRRVVQEMPIIMTYSTPRTWKGYQYLGMMTVSTEQGGRTTAETLYFDPPSYDEEEE